MVYCGKPSKACEGCRSRRTKCDVLRPSCSQCIRAGRACTGYRDPSDLMFRDESQTLSKKRLANSEKQRTATAKSSKVIKAKCNAEICRVVARLPSSGPLLSIELGTSAEDQASCFFFRNYVLGEHDYNNGYFQYLADIYIKEDVGDALGDSVTALGLVGLSHFWKSSNILTTATVKYHSALTLINSCLRDVKDAKSNQTLVTVMLLGLYETNTCTSAQSMASWTKHVKGAAALLNLRGKQQLETSIGRQLFVHLRTQVITNCIQRHCAVPPSISEWSGIVISYETPEEAAVTELAELAIEFAKLRATMNSFNDYNNAEFIINELCTLDLKYSDWVSRCPAHFLYSTKTLGERCDDVFSDHYHVYSSIWTGTVWNHYRCLRILVNEVIVDQIRYLLEEPTEYSWLYENQVQASHAMLLQLSHDICSSVPYFMGFHKSLSDGARRQPPKGVSGNLLLWPLFTAACTGMSSDMMRFWVAGRLKIISDVLGIRQAAPLAHTLGLKEDHPVLDEWEAEDIQGLGYTPPTFKTLKIKN